MVIAPSDGAVINAAALRPQKPSAVLIDNPGLNGDGVTVTLGWKAGTATVYLTDPDGDGFGPIELIELAGTDPAKSTLTIAVKRPRGGTGDGRARLAEVAGTGLKALTAVYPGWLDMLELAHSYYRRFQGDLPGAGAPLLHLVERLRPGSGQAWAMAIVAHVTWLSASGRAAEAV